MASPATSRQALPVDADAPTDGLPGPRTWTVRERIGDYDEVLGTVSAVHGPNAYAKAIKQFRIFDTERMNRLRLDPIG